MEAINEGGLYENILRSTKLLGDNPLGLNSRKKYHISLTMETLCWRKFLIKTNLPSVQVKELAHANTSLHPAEVLPYFIPALNLILCYFLPSLTPVLYS